MRVKSVLHQLGIGAALLALATQASAVAPLFADDAELALTITGPFERINDEREKEEEYPGSVSYTGPDGTVEREVKLSPRGHFRLQERICDSVPLWLDFDKDELEGTVFAGQNRLKMVVQCRDSSTYREYVAKEEQLYRMFALLSDLSMKTRRINATFVDSESGDTRTEPAFLIQHHKRLAEQHGMEELEVPRILRAKLDPQQANLVALFMYMIANADYSMAAGKPNDDCCHNTKPLVDAEGVVYPIPYDFDSTGYVDARYAELPVNVRIDDIRDRVYRGYCIHNGALEDNLALMRSKRDELLAIASEEGDISGWSAKKSRKFIEKFFKIIDSERKVKWEITGPCLGERLDES